MRNVVTGQKQINDGCLITYCIQYEFPSLSTHKHILKGAPKIKANANFFLAVWNW